MCGVPTIAGNPREGSRLLRFRVKTPNTNSEIGTTRLSRARNSFFAATSLALDAAGLRPEAGSPCSMAAVEWQRSPRIYVGDCLPACRRPRRLETQPPDNFLDLVVNALMRPHEGGDDDASRAIEVTAVEVAQRQSARGQPK